MTSRAVLIDTDIFSALAINSAAGERRSFPISAWRDALGGRSIVISFQTRAEVIFGLYASTWSDRRIAEALAALDATPTVGVDSEVIEAFARLSADCRRAGHGLQQKVHVADRWIAACAIAKGLPLLARDGIYRGTPGITLLEM